MSDKLNSKSNVKDEEPAKAGFSPSVGSATVSQGNSPNQSSRSEYLQESQVNPLKWRGQLVRETWDCNDDNGGRVMKLVLDNNEEVILSILEFQAWMAGFYSLQNVKDEEPAQAGFSPFICSTLGDQNLE